MEKLEKLQSKRLEIVKILASRFEMSSKTDAEWAEWVILQAERLMEYVQNGPKPSK